MSSESCLFCKIDRGEIPADKVHEDAELLAIRDINPAAPTHVLILPRAHIETINDLDASHVAMVGRAYLLAVQLARAEGFADAGYRVVANCNRDGGQSVYHVHFHLLGGRKFGWPPG